jgi:hypothetical protein
VWVNLWLPPISATITRSLCSLSNLTYKGVLEDILMARLKRIGTASAGSLAARSRSAFARASAQAHLSSIFRVSQSQLHPVMTEACYSLVSNVDKFEVSIGSFKAVSTPI